MTRSKIMLAALLVMALSLFGGKALAQRNAVTPPPPPGGAKAPLYDSGRLLEAAFPKYFTYLADGRGLGGGGVVRVTVKYVDPKTGRANETLCEVREVGEILASNERGPFTRGGDGEEKARTIGRTLLSTNDEVMVRFTEDLAKILDSDTYGDSDPYFREFPIYGVGETVQSTTEGRVDKFNSVGEIYQYKGRLTVAARVEGLAPISAWDSSGLKKRKNARNQDAEPVSYVARITYAEDAVQWGDRVFLFNPLEPGPERQLDPPFLEPAGGYNSLGN